MKKIVYTILYLSPALTLAQTTKSFNTGYFETIVTSIKKIVKDLIPVFFAVAIIFFFWSMIKFIQNAGSNPAKAGEAKMGIVWSLVAIAVMASVWGIVAFLGGIFGVNTSGGGTIQPPTVTGL
jgi:hypothetical protein